jgi:hypothetical protein
MAYGDSKWVIVYSSGTNFTEQRLIFSNEFPFREIKELKNL